MSLPDALAKAIEDSDLGDIEPTASKVLDAIAEWVTSCRLAMET